MKNTNLIKKGIYFDQKGAASSNKKEKERLLKKAMIFLRNAEKKEDSPLVKKWIGNVYLHSGRFKMALRYFEKGLQMTKNKKDMMNLYNDMGNALRGLKKYDEALKYYKKSFKYLKGKRERESALLYVKFIINLDKKRLKEAKHSGLKLLKRLPQYPQNETEKKFRKSIEAKVRNINSGQKITL